MTAGPPWAVLLGWPGAVPEATWILVAGSAAGAAILLAAVLGLMRPAAAVPARLGWLLAAAGLAATAVAGAAGLDRGGAAASGLPDLPAVSGVSIMTAGLLLAATTGLHGLTGGLRGRSFGPRHVLAATTALAIGLGGAGATATGWHAAAGLDRVPGTAQGEQIPALARDLAGGPDRARVLALTAGTGGIVAELWRGDGPQVSDRATVLRVRERASGASGASGGSTADSPTGLRELVGELSVGAAEDAAARLATHAIAIVLVPPGPADPAGTADTARPADPADTARPADTAATAGPAGVRAYGAARRARLGRGARADHRERDGRVLARRRAGPGGPVVVTDAAGTATVVPAGAVIAAGDIGAGSDRTVVLAERADPGWRAWFDGQRLRAVQRDWQQAFEIPDGEAGRLIVRYEPAGTRVWHLSLLIVFGLTTLLALPTRRRRRESDR
ncbi:hypothetical protein [Pseudactinotalea sp. HY158]|uniref:hypothetical protein n=1 Tax=Pseudactinotalea sp. HY158 TaxID=2654547 RepID=UPI00129C7AEB|nr:hypothetical protein [Pseudactinotalea sp. HY158]QGH68839.1 hypothetical protein GCE65_04500 [Pseudactinotalea sp. HY158]